MCVKFVLPVCVLLCGVAAHAQNPTPREKPRIVVSPNQRFLMREDGTPFFYLADTAWEMFHRLTFEEADAFMQLRAKQGFNVLQVMVLEEHDGLDVPSVSGHTALIERDPTRPNEPYFAHIDRVVARANELGLTIAMLPTWGDKWNKKWGKGPEIFTPENARMYGKWIAARYRNADIIWVLGGDRPVENDTHRAILRAMAEGVREGDGGRHLITFHPTGGQRSSQYFHSEPWLDFNMAQTGHGRNSTNYRVIEDDYKLTPTKPCLDGEPGYEAHPAGFNLANGHLNDFDARRAAWWAALSGAAGHTYGCHAIWQFYDERRDPVNFPAQTWREAQHLPGATQMRHVRTLLESLPYFTRRPAPEIIRNNPKEEHRRIVASTDATSGQSDGTYILVYVPYADIAPTLDLTPLKDSEIAGVWYNPRTGERLNPFPVKRGSSENFCPPSRFSALDWVLILQTKN